MRETFIFCGETQNTPRIIEGMQTNFMDLEHNYCCDLENRFYEIKNGELKYKRKFESFTEFWAQTLQKNFKNGSHL